MDNVPVRVSKQASAGRHASGPSDTPPKSSKPKKNKLKFFGLSVGAVVLVALLVFGGLSLYRTSTAAAIDSSKYQAVFFTSGQVYFGKLQPINGDYMRLTDVFYLQAQSDEGSENPQKASSQTEADVQLVKLGNEIHGPADEMIISKSKILFFENLKNEGKVSQSIISYNEQTN